MGLKFRKSIKIAPGVKVNLGKKSVGMSIGGKYGGVSMNSKTGTRARVSAPGTGLSYSSKIGGTENNRYSASTSVTSTAPQAANIEKNKWVSFFLCLLLGFIGAHKFYEGKAGMGVLYIFTCGLFCIGWIIDTIVILTKPNPYYV